MMPFQRYHQPCTYRTSMRLSDVTIGGRLVADGGFGCIPAGKVVVVEGDRFDPFVRCTHGRHHLKNQMDCSGNLIGFTPVGTAFGKIAEGLTEVFENVSA